MSNSNKQQEKASTSFFQPFRTEVVISALVGLLGLVFGAIVNAHYGFLSRDRELNIRLVEIGLSILRADPSKEDISPARQWAIEVVQKNSGVEFTPEDRAALLHKPIATGGTYYDTSTPVDTGFDHSEPLCKLKTGPRGPYFECPQSGIAPLKPSKPQ